MVAGSAVLVLIAMLVPPAALAQVRADRPSGASDDAVSVAPQPSPAASAALGSNGDTQSSAQQTRPPPERERPSPQPPPGQEPPAPSGPAPVVTATAPTSGTVAGGTSVVVTGTGFSGATAVDFGNFPAASFSVDSDTRIVATSPSPTFCPREAVDVTVVAGGARSQPSAAARFAYDPSTCPAVSGLDPSKGPAAGGTSVTITGTGFTGTTSVSFGRGVPAASFTVESDTGIVAISPPRPDCPGTVDVTVTVGELPSDLAPADVFTYEACPPQVGDIQPATGPPAGGTAVVLTGARLSGATAAKFGDVSLPCPSSACTLTGDDRMVAVSPPHAVGAVDVVVTSANGVSAPVRFFYSVGGAFSPTGPCPSAGCAGGAAVRLGDGKVLVVGGGANTGEAALYDPLTNTWRSTQSCLSCGNYGFTLTALEGGKVLAVGTFAPTASVYDPGSGSWAPTGPMTMGRGSHTATALPDGKVLVAGGTPECCDPVASAEVYDATTNGWRAVDAMTTPRISHTATPLADGKVLVVGGMAVGTEADPGPRSIDTAELYDPATGRWTETSSPLGQGRWGHSATALADGRVLVAGGLASEFIGRLTSYVDSVEVYDPRTGTWSLDSIMVAARAGHAAVLLPSGKVLAVGGDLYPFGRGGNDPSLTELYDPQSRTWKPSSSAMSLPEAPALGSYLTANATVLPSGPMAQCGVNCGKVLLTPGRDVAETPHPGAMLYSPPPEVIGVSPSTGPPEGGTVVTLTGTGLAQPLAVSFGGVAATVVTPDRESPDTKLTVVAPAHAVGAVDLTVSTAGGISPAVRFTYGSGGGGGGATGGEAEGGAQPASVLAGEASSPSSQTSGSSSRGGGRLPQTGLGNLGPIALGLIALGALLVSATRRRQQHRPPIV